MNSTKREEGPLRCANPVWLSASLTAWHSCLRLTSLKPCARSGREDLPTTPLERIGLEWQGRVRHGIGKSVGVSPSFCGRAPHWQASAGFPIKSA